MDIGKIWYFTTTTTSSEFAKYDSQERSSGGLNAKSNLWISAIKKWKLFYGSRTNDKKIIIGRSLECCSSMYTK